MNNATLRSCWECNSAHEHLKACKELNCIACGNEYELGVKVGEGPALLDGFESLGVSIVPGSGRALVIEDLVFTLDRGKDDASS